MNKLHLLAFVAVLAVASGFVIRPYPNSKVLDPEGAFTLYWDSKAHEIDLEFVVKTTGWVGFAIVSESGDFADFLWAGVNDNTTLPYFEDMHMDLSNGTHSVPEVDSSSSHVVLQGAVQDEETTTIRIKRRYDTEDPEDVAIIAGDMTIGWSWSDSDSTEDPHTNAGFTTVALLPGF